MPDDEPLADAFARALDGGTLGEVLPAAAGRLLVATPVLGDPNFLRTVVGLLQADEDGAVGVVLDRPSSRPVEDLLPSWTSLVTAPPVLFGGGPVGQDAALGLARLRAAAPDGTFAPLVEDPAGTLGTVDLDADPALLEPVLAALRVYAGYSGWGPGQLQGEIAEGAWWVVESLPTDWYAAEPARLWSAVVRRQGASTGRGRSGLMATWPADTSLN